MGFYKRQHHSSTEFVQAETRYEKDGQPYDPTADLVSMAFSSVDAVDPGQFYPSQWETEVSGPITTYLISCLVGPAGIVALQVGKYKVWAKIADSPEVPIVPCGILEIT